jgi:hypothetical protein
MRNLQTATTLLLDNHLLSTWPTGWPWACPVTKKANRNRPIAIAGVCLVCDDPSTNATPVTLMDVDRRQQRAVQTRRNGMKLSAGSLPGEATAWARFDAGSS